MFKGKKAFIITGSIILLLTIISIINKKKIVNHKRPTSVRVEVDQVKKGSITRNIQVVGTLVANRSVSIRAQTQGVIAKVHIRGGEEVEKGSPLFTLDDRAFRAALKEARAVLTAAAAQFKRVKELSEKKIRAASKLEEARTNFLKAQAGYEKAFKQLEDTKIIAPYEGIVSLHEVSIGATVDPSKELVTITDMDPIKATFKVQAKYLNFLNIGQEIKITSKDLKDKKFIGTIEAKDSTIDQAAQTVAIKAYIDNSNRQLCPGMFVRIKLVAGSKDNALIIQEQSLIATDGESYVWQAIKYPNVPNLYLAKKVPVVVGLQEKDRVEIISNLKENDIIITVGYHKIGPNFPIKFDTSRLEGFSTTDTDSSNKTDKVDSSSNTQNSTDSSNKTDKVDSSSNTQNSTDSSNKTDKIDSSSNTQNSTDSSNKTDKTDSSSNTQNSTDSSNKTDKTDSSSNADNSNNQPDSHLKETEGKK